MENFFGLLKTKMFHDQEDNYKRLDDLIKKIDEFINYYNYDKIKMIISYKLHYSPLIIYYL